jgi:hypothetical protein
MAARTSYAFILILQATTLALLLYVVIGGKRSQITIVIPSNLVEADPLAPSGNQYGLSSDDAARLEDLVAGGEGEVQEEGLARYRTVYRETLLQKTLECEDVGIPDALQAKLERYQAMSEEEKKQFEAELAERILGSREVRELTNRISNALHEVEPSSQSAAPPNRQDEHDGDTRPEE